MRTAGFAAWGRWVTRGLGPLALAAPAIVLAPACRGDGATATGDADTSAGDLPTTGGASGPTVSTETTAIEPGSSTGTSTTGTAGTTGVGAEATSSGNAEATADTTAGTSSSGSTGATTETSGDAESTAATLLLDPPPPHFTDVTDDAGVWYVQGVVQQAPHCLIDQLGPGNFGFCVPEREIAGAAVADIDGDDDLDLFVTRTNGSNLLFANDGAGTFLEVSAARGLTEVGHSSGAAFGDVDNDGDADLFVATVASYAHRLYINDGTGHFVEDALARGAAIDTGELHIGTTPTFGDFDLDGYLDLYVGEWTIVAQIGAHPSHARLLRNLGDAAPGSFEDVTQQAGVVMDGAWALAPDTAPGTYAFAAAFVDLDDDRYPELAISADYGTSRLFWNDGDGTFTDRTTEVGVGLEANGMGSTLGDYDNDGDIDWYVTSLSNAQFPADNRLYRNSGARSFDDVAGALGVDDNGWGWGAAFFDADNDGDLDLVAGAGYYLVVNQDDPLKLWRNEGDAPMLDVSDAVGFGPPRQRRGILSWDYDADGDLDLFVSNTGDAPELYRNDGAEATDWLRVRVVGTTSNRDGLGARVHLRLGPGLPGQMREIGVGSHYMGHGERTAHFGLGDGDDPVAEVRVVWPASDTEQIFHDVARNQTLVVVEP